MAFGPTIKIVCTQEEYDTVITRIKWETRIKLVLSIIILLLINIICSKLYNNLLMDKYFEISTFIISSIIVLHNMSNNIKDCSKAIELINIRTIIFNSLIDRELYCFITVDKPNGTTIVIGDRKNGGLYLRYFVEYKLPRLGKDAIIFLKLTSVAVYPKGLDK